MTPQEAALREKRIALRQKLENVEANLAYYQERVRQAEQLRSRLAGEIHTITCKLISGNVKN